MRVWEWLAMLLLLQFSFWNEVNGVGMNFIKTFQAQNGSSTSDNAVEIATSDYDPIQNVAFFGGRSGLYIVRPKTHFFFFFFSSNFDRFFFFFASSTPVEYNEQYLASKMLWSVQRWSKCKKSHD
jgi:hypothetical protein